MQLKTLEQTKRRIHWIDISRGIAIILVMYGHLFASDNSRYLIYSFHMPLFFFISGLVFKPSNKPFLTTAGKYFKQLLIPYYIFAIFTFLFALVSQTTKLSLDNVGYQLWGILYGSGRDGMLGYNVVLWFLPCLFITKLSFAAITNNIYTTKKIILFLVGSAFLGSLFATFLPEAKLPLGFESSLTALPFLGAGYLLARHREILSNFTKYKLPIAVGAMLIMALGATLNFHVSGSQIDMRVNQLDNIPLFYLGAFSGIIGWTAISQILKENAFLEYIGKHSMVIFAWHNILFVDLENIVNSVVTQNLLNALHPFMATIYVGMAMSIILFSRLLLVRLKSAYRFIFP